VSCDEPHKPLQLLAGYDIINIHPLMERVPLKWSFSFLISYDTVIYQLTRSLCGRYVVNINASLDPHQSLQPPSLLIDNEQNFEASF
jgi:hypothetical protein